MSASRTNTATHTPGPWNVSGDTAIVCKDGGLSNVVGWVKVFDGVSINQAQANARLIASAPELLAALIELAEGYESRCGDWENPDFNECYRKAEAAIKKARGE